MVRIAAFENHHRPAFSALQEITVERAEGEFPLAGFPDQAFVRDRKQFDEKSVEAERDDWLFPKDAGLPG